MNKRTKALAISNKVKIAVNERDWGLCVYCKRPGNPDSHYIRRSQGGLGIPENICVMCQDCHRAYDNYEPLRDGIKAAAERNFKKHYPDWNPEDLIYRK